jgi:hypothetical protein
MRDREASEYIRPRNDVEELRHGAGATSARSVASAGTRRDAGRLDGRVPRVFGVCASISLVTAVFAAAARAIEPFDHGIWLVAYLFLVGFMAQYLLARGQSMLSPTGQPAADAPPIREQATLWNAGVVGVPVGVFADARLLVVLGSVALLASLGAFWHAYGSVRLEPDIELGALRVAYRALILFMAASTLVGTALAWDIPWL